jgi:hypothetical protein
LHYQVFRDLIWRCSLHSGEVPHRLPIYNLLRLLYNLSRRIRHEEIDSTWWGLLQSFWILRTLRCDRWICQGHHFYYRVWRCLQSHRYLFQSRQYYLLNRG